MATYLVVIGKTTTGYSAHCPDVPGCAAVGRTISKVIRNMKAALEFHFAGLGEDGEAIPKPRGVAAYRQIMKHLDLDNEVLAHVQIDARRFAQRLAHA